MEELQKQIDALKQEIENLKRSSTIPIEIDQAFRGRFSLPTSSTKSASSENQAVNEGGVATYSVLKPPGAFIQIVVNNTVYYIPVFI